MFTQEQIEEISRGLEKLSQRDTDFNTANFPFDGEEIVALVQGGSNVKAKLSEAVNQAITNGKYYIDLGITDLNNTSTSEEIISIVGTYDELKNAVDNKKSIIIAGTVDGNYMEYMTAYQASSTENTVTLILTFQNGAPYGDIGITILSGYYIITLASDGEASIIYSTLDAIQSNNVNEETFQPKENLELLDTNNKTIVGSINEVNTNVNNLKQESDEIYHYVAQAVLSNYVRRIEVVKALPDNQLSDVLYVVVPDLPDENPGIGEMTIGDTFIIR